MPTETPGDEGWTRVTIRLPISMREALEDFYDQAPKDTDRGADSPEARTLRWLLRRGLVGLKRGEAPGLAAEEKSLRRRAVRSFIALREKNPKAAGVWLYLAANALTDPAGMNLLLGLDHLLGSSRALRGRESTDARPATHPAPKKKGGNAQSGT